MSKRPVLSLLVILMLLIPGVIVLAQGPPDAINDALADLSSRVGVQLSLTDLTSWRWSQQNFPDTSLGCPQPGQSYSQVVTNGYQFILEYNGITYDYRVAANRSILILCSPSAQTTTAPQATAIPTLTPAATVQVRTPTPAAQAVCPGAMPTQLSVGMQARARANNIPKNIRSEPTTSSAILGRIPGGGTVDIVDGPACGEGFVWWKVDFDTLIGWAAEGQFGVYWLEPMSVTQLVPTQGATSAAPIRPQIYDLPAQRQVIGADNVETLIRFAELPVNEAANAAAWSPDGATLAVAGRTGIWLYSTAAFTTPPRFLQVPNGPVYDLAFSSGGVLASAHNDTTVRLWNVAVGGQRAVLRGHTQPVRAVAFNTDGTILASGGGNAADGAASEIRIWDPATGTQIALLEGHTGPVTGLAFSPDGTLLASSSMDDTVRLWDVISATPATTLEGHTQMVNAIAFSPNGEQLVSASNDGTVRVWDIATGEHVTLEGHEDWVTALAFSPDGTVLASGGGAINGSGDNSVRLWDLESQEELTALDDHGAAPEATVRDLLFSPDGTVLVFVTVQGEQSMVRLWGITP